MAEFCLECFNKLNGTNYSKEDVILSTDLCEGCGEVKPCVVGFKPRIPIILVLIALVGVIGYFVITRILL